MKKTAIFTLVVTFVVMMAAGLSELHMSRLLLAKSNQEFLESSNQRFEQLVEKVRTGEIDTTGVIELMRKGRKNGDLEREIHVQLSRLLAWIGWGTFIIAVLQAYVLIRGTKRKRDAEPIAASKT